jgi:[acyl-carrier-protein] S-malonyltransferase
MSHFAFLFTGQGAQAVGMLNGFAGNPVVDQTVQEASDALGVDLQRLIADGPKEDLDLTTNTQPVMLTAAVAVYRAWIAAGGPIPSVVAGHSLGEYSALVAAGVIPFADAVPLVRFRAQSMQDAVPVGQGGMAVILGLQADDVRAVCTEAAHGEVVEAVNFNELTQIVIAGHTAAVERACEIAKAKGAKRAMKLSVSAPFHSSLLKPASDRLREYMRTLTFAVPQIPVINNVDVVVLNDPEQIKDALVRQAAGPVRWVETMQKMAQDGVTQVIECPPASC